MSSAPSPYCGYKTGGIDAAKAPLKGVVFHIIHVSLQIVQFLPLHQQLFHQPFHPGSLVEQESWSGIQKTLINNKYVLTDVRKVRKNLTLCVCVVIWAWTGAPGKLLKLTCNVPWQSGDGKDGRRGRTVGPLVYVEKRFCFCHRRWIGWFEGVGGLARLRRGGGAGPHRAGTWQIYTRMKGRPTWPTHSNGPRWGAGRRAVGYVKCALWVGGVHRWTTARSWSVQGNLYLVL